MANSVAERFNLTLLSRMRSQLAQCGLPLALWGELAIYSSHQINCSPSKTINFRTPMDMMVSVTPSHSHPFDYGRLKPFGCLAFAHDLHRTSKVEPVAKRFIFVGVEQNARAWRLWDKTTRRIFVTGDADIREDVFPAADNDQSPIISPSTLNNSLDHILSDVCIPLNSSSTTAEECDPSSSDKTPSFSDTTTPLSCIYD